MSNRSSSRRESVNQALNQKAEKQSKQTEKEGVKTPKVNKSPRESPSPGNKKTKTTSAETFGTGQPTEFKVFQDEIRSFFEKYDETLDKRLSAFDKKFSNIFEELKKEMNGLRDEVFSTKTEMKMMKTKIDDMEKSLEFQAQLQEEREDSNFTTIDRYEQEMNELKDKLLRQEVHDRRYNLLFYGFQEKAKEDLETDMKTFFKRQLEIPDTEVDEMIIANIHRIPSETKGPKPVIIKFVRMSDREKVFSKFLHPILRTEKKRILSDLPVVMKKERGKLAKRAYDIRQNEELQTRIVERGLSLHLEVRKEKGKPWEIYKEKEESGKFDVE